MSDYKISKNSFRLVQADTKIFDTKLETKPTTFLKDAFRRFCKNKSSVVGAIILGILILLTIFVPLFSPHDVVAVSKQERFLQPKLFEAGTGWWDGTKDYTRIIYDTDSEAPANFYKPAVLSIVVDTEPTYVEQANTYGKGGYVMFSNENTASLEVGKLTSSVFTATSNGSYTATFNLSDEDNVAESRIGEYRIVLNVKDSDKVLVLKPWSREYGKHTVDISKALTEAGLTSADVTLSFELKADSQSYTYLLIENCTFDNAKHTLSEELGFTDATHMVLKAKDSLGNYPEGYWTCIGRKGIHSSVIYYCDFVYDTYAAVYDDQEVVYAASDFQKMIDNGWCSYDSKVGPESFVKLSDECPIDSIISQKLNSKTKKLLEVTAEVPRYRFMGYTKAPSFILGTDANGNDVLTKMFTGLRTSLILGVCTAAFCFMFGLIWGSVSGYFGGNVDLFMERFCDILGGVPWIVVMTLCILHLGNNFFTFFLALCMTGWMGTAARTRTQFYRFKGREYVLASRTLGSSDVRLIFKHILPNSLGTIVTSSVLMIPSTIFSEATLSYLNLGLKGLTAFGVMLSDNQQYIQSHSYLIVFPSVIMALMMISFNLFGNGLRDAINPTLKGMD